MTQHQDWLTRAEKSDYEETSRYPETIDYCLRLEKASPWIRFTTFGRSPEGRDLPLLIVSRDGLFEAGRARQSQRAIILIINGIHPGEIAGKEASFMLLRDLAITRQKESLLENVILLVVPIYNVDGHERVSAYNRINQVGPREMGFRTTSQNLNLNRDWMKAEQPETRDMLNLFYTWLPDFVIDNHVSDGADFQYSITWVADDHFAVAPPVLEYFAGRFQPSLIDALEKRGHYSMQYFEMEDSSDPAKGIRVGPFQPRFCNSFCTLNNRPGMTTESHALKTYRTRIEAHYALMEEALKQFHSDPGALRRAVREADEATVKLGETYDPQSEYPVRMRIDRTRVDTLRFRGIEYKREQSAISGATKITYGSKPLDFDVRYSHTLEPDITIAPPIGYAIPPQWTQVLDRLEAHHIEFTRLEKEVTGSFQTYRFTDVSWDPTPFEGRHMAHFRSRLVTEERTLPAQTILVRLNQRNNKVILGLLEPDSPDSLVAWGFFDMLFEDKEYAEDYVLERLATEMLANDPALKAEFEAKLNNDSGFAGDPAARLRFFLDRSPYSDQRKNAYPIVRITDLSQIL